MSETFESIMRGLSEIRAKNIEKEIMAYRKDELIKQCNDFIDDPRFSEDKKKSIELALFTVCSIKYPNLFSEGDSMIT